MRFFILLSALCFMSFPAAADQDMPVKRVVLSTGGLGYFEHGATLSGNDDLSFPVRLNQVNDILKSLLVFDPAGGLQDVSLPGKEPLEQLFRDLPFSQYDLANPVSILSKYQGAEIIVHIDGQQYSGRLMGVVEKNEVIDDVKVTRHILTLLMDQKMMTFIYEDVNHIEWQDASIQNEITRALEAVRESGQSDRRRLTIDFADGAARNVMLSYVVEAPLWKTSYRLVLPNSGDDQGHLQGWAIVENLTGGDWTDVELSLTSGSPVTLQQDLYPAYFTSRPFVPVDVFGRVMPRRDDGAMASDEVAEAFGRKLGGGAMNRMRGNFAEADMMQAELAAAPMMAKSSLSNMTAGQNVAGATETMAQVEFKFPQKFTLESGKTMMVPFINQKLEMQNVALYQPDQQPNHPFLSVSVMNASNSTLPPGILTIYNQGVSGNSIDFVGDAQMAFLPKGEKRMVSYALDQKTKIDRKQNSLRKVGGLKAENGVLKSSVRYINETVYTVKPPADEDRKLVIEHPRMGDYKLAGQADNVEVTETHYRIPLDLKAGETQSYTARLVRTVWETVQINSMMPDQILAFIASNDELSDSAKKQLEQLAVIRRETAAIERQIQDAENRKKEIYDNQSRIRENIQALSGSSDLKERYLSQLNEQEDALEDLDKQIFDLRGKLREKQVEMRTVINNLNL